ncbi:MAG: hypothetical protein ACYTBR_16190 [Planctomycetota bacterium]|jgi:hypothetical protein
MLPSVAPPLWSAAIQTCPSRPPGFGSPQLVNSPMSTRIRGSKVTGIPEIFAVWDLTT